MATRSFITAREATRLIKVIGFMLVLGVVFTAIEMVGAWFLIRSFH